MKFNYNKRNFIEIKEDIKNNIKLNYPDVFNNFEDNSVGSVFIDILAASSEALYYNLDRSVQETQIENAQLKKSLFNIAQTLGVKLFNKKAAITLVDITVRVPANGDTYSREYLPIIKAGTQFNSNNTVAFELIDDVDFSNEYSTDGLPNRTIIPETNNLNQIVNYVITKREIVYNGSTKIANVLIDENLSRPFATYILPDLNVLSIESVILKTGVITETPTQTEFNDTSLRYFEVDSLAQPNVFIDDQSFQSNQSFKKGKWYAATKKFIKEFNENGVCRLTFGGGNGDLPNFTDSLNNIKTTSKIANYLYNTALGETLPINSTLFIKYRIGGGAETNVPAGSINSISNPIIEINGINPTLNETVRNSITVNNPIPSFGGRDSLTVDELRNFIKYNNLAQYRSVTLLDYYSNIYNMPGKYGMPFKFIASKEDNKVIISILGLDSENKLNNTSTNLLKENISEYLSDNRMLNDYVEVRDGRIYNLGYEITVLVDNNTSNDFNIITNVTKELYKFHSIYKNNMGENIYVGKLYEVINNIPNVININGFKIFNLVGNGYSDDTLSIGIKDSTTNEIDTNEGIIYNTNDGMFEIKYTTDIKVTIKKLGR